MRELFLLLLLSSLGLGQLQAQIIANCDGNDPKVLLAGDSWAQYMGDDDVHNELLDQYGLGDLYLLTETLGGLPHTPYNGPAYAVSGSLASQWADTDQYSFLANMVAALSANPTVEWVVLSIGGNDVLAGRSEGGWYKDMDLDSPNAESDLFDEIEANTLMIINAALAVRPSIKVLISSYEYPNFDVEFGTCWIYACDKREDLSRDPNNDLITNVELNAMMLITESRRQQMADNMGRVFYDNSIGLMHHVYGSSNTGEGLLPKPQATTPYAPGGDPTRPTLRQNFRIWGDPIHLDAAGYNYKVKNQMDNHLFNDLRGEPDATFFSEGGNQDGWVDIIGNNAGSNGIRMGDNGSSTDWRGILSFNTSSLPDNAQVTGASIYLHRSGEGFGSNPYSLNDRSPHVDIKQGSFGTAAIEVGDGTAPADGIDVGCFHGDVSDDYHVTRIDINPAYLQHFNVNGRTQFRIYFDEADFIPNYVNYFDGSQQGVNSNEEERSALEEPHIVFEEQIVTTEQADGSTVEEIQMVAAVAHNGLSELMGTTAPFLDVSYELVLPVELVSFRAAAVDDEVTLNWETALEEGFRGFGIERSKDGIRWERLTFQTGSNQEGNTYTYLDRNPFLGLNYYRLSMEDLDGTSSFSEIKEVVISKVTNEILIYPNPADEVLNVMLTTPLESASIVSLIDVLGRELNSWSFQELGISQLILNLPSALPSGQYWLRIQGAGEAKLYKLYNK